MTKTLDLPAPAASRAARGLRFAVCVRWEYLPGTDAVVLSCHYQPGDIVPCREPYSIIDGIWDIVDGAKTYDDDCVFYRATRSSRSFDHYDKTKWKDSDFYDEAMIETLGDGWRPASEMPDWAIRTKARILTVTPKRVRDVTESEAEMTGIERLALSPEYIEGIGRVHPRTSHYLEAFLAAHPDLRDDDWVWVVTGEAAGRKGE